MIKKLSRIFGITGGVLALLPYVLLIGRSVINLIFYPDVLYRIAPEVIILRNTAPALLCSAPIIAGIYVRKKPIFAGVVMIVSYMINVFTPQGGPIPDELTTVVRQLSALLLVLAGVFAIISRFTGNKASSDSVQTGQETVENRNPLLYLSRITAIICAAASMLIWVIISIYALCSMPITELLLLGLSTPLVLSAFGLWGSILLRKKPVIGAVLIFVSGVLIFLFSLVFRRLGVTDLWLGIGPLLLIAAGAFGIIARKTSVSKSPLNEAPDKAG